MSRSWAWITRPWLQAGCTMGSWHAGLVLDLQLPELPESERLAAARALERALAPGAPELARAPDAAALALRAFTHAARLGDMPVAEPITVLHRDDARLALRIPVLPRLAPPLADACEAMVTVLRDPAAEASWRESWATALSALQAPRPRSAMTFRFMRAAEALGMPTLELAAHAVQYGQGRRSRWLDTSFTESTSVIASQLARDKAVTASMLRRAGLPVPGQREVADAAAAVQAAARLGYPVVVKPADRDAGMGVSVGLVDEPAVAAAFERARAISRRVLVEQFIPGRDYRLVVHAGELVLAVERIVAGVTGDGRSTVAQLVEALNADPRRRDPQGGLRPVAIDEEAVDLLRDARLSPDAVPAAGRFVRLRRAANVATGGTPVDVLARVHPDNARLAVRAAAALRLDLAGVDLLIPDIARSWHETGAGICEVNVQPNLGFITSGHLYPSLLRRIVPGTGRIPVVAVLGAPPARSPISAIEAAIAARGLRVGTVDERGMRLAGVTLRHGAVPVFAGMQALLQDREMDVLIVAVNDAALLTSGLPCPRLDVLALAGTVIHVREGEDAAAQHAQLEDMLRRQCDGEIAALDPDDGSSVARVADAVATIDARHASAAAPDAPARNPRGPRT